MVRVAVEQLTWQEVEGELVVLDLATSSYLALNRVGAFLWPALVEGASRDGLVAELVSNFVVDDEQAGRDVDEFLAELARRNLLDHPA